MAKGRLGNLNLTKVSSWSPPEGMVDGGAGSPFLNDPDIKDGEDLSWLDQNTGRDPETGEIVPLEDIYRKELEAFGDGVYLNPTTAAALSRFQQTRIYGNTFVSPSTPSSTRWAVRPFITNKLAGGIDDSYHLTGEAVDIRHRGITSSDSKDLQDIVIQAIASGFRGIGFGTTQFHFDTREGGRNGFFGYVYQGWPTDLTPGRVIKSIITGPRMPEEQRVSEAEANRIIKDVRVPESQTGSRGARAIHMSERDLEKYIIPLYGQEETNLDLTKQSDLKQKVDGTAPQTQSTGFLGGVLATTALLGLILGGIYGFRRFLRNRREQQEAQKIAMDQKKRVIISRFRAKNARLIKKAKKDPEIAARLEQELRAEFELFGIDVD